MNREYHRWWSKDLSREMELLVFGHDGQPVMVFPTSCGRFYEFEDRGMVQAVRDKIDGGRLQLICVDSVDAESWYNTSLGVDRRAARHVSYENYLLQDVVPLIRSKNHSPHLVTAGCSFGGFHAVNLALRHPHLFTGCLSMSGAFDLRELGFLDGPYDDNCYYNLPLDYVPNIHDHHYLERLRHNTILLATGMHDPCWNDNEKLAGALRAKGIPVRLDVWGDNAGHDWPWWQRMAQAYL